MNESATLSIWRQIASHRVLEAFNYGGLPTSIMAHDHSEWLEKLDDIYFMKERTPRMASLSNSAIVALNYVVSMMMTVRHKYIQCRQGAARRGVLISHTCGGV